MKQILTFLLLIATLYAQDSSKKLTLGGGAYLQTQPYKGVENILLPSPFIYYSGDLFYAKWTRFGMYFYGSKSDDLSWGFSLTAQPRVYGYKASDSTYLTGMSERKNSIEAGLALSLQKEKAFLDMMLLTDILHKSDAWIAQTELGYEFTLGKLQLYPSFLLTYQSSAFSNYYYGVKATEVSSSRPQYSAQSGIQLGVQTYIEYPLTKKLSTLINLHAEKLSSEATASPLVNDDYIYSGLVSLIYTFEY